jgi:hypothetical protein
MTEPVEEPLCGAWARTPIHTHRCALAATDPHTEQLHVCRDDDGYEWSAGGPVAPQEGTP